MVGTGLASSVSRPLVADDLVVGAAIAVSRTESLCDFLELPPPFPEAFGLKFCSEPDFLVDGGSTSRSYQIESIKMSEGLSRGFVTRSEFWRDLTMLSSSYWLI